MVPVHVPSDAIWWLSATLSVTLDGFSSISRCFCACHFDVHMVFFIVLPSTTACTRTLSPCGPCRCTHLWYTQLRLVVFICFLSLIVSKASGRGAVYNAILSCSVCKTALEKNDITLLCPCPSLFLLMFMGLFGHVSLLGAGHLSSMQLAPPHFPVRHLLTQFALHMLRIPRHAEWMPHSVGCSSW